MATGFTNVQLLGGNRFAAQTSPFSEYQIYDGTTGKPISSLQYTNVKPIGDGYFAESNTAGIGMMSIVGPDLNVVVPNAFPLNVRVQYMGNGLVKYTGSLGNTQYVTIPNVQSTSTNKPAAQASASSSSKTSTSTGKPVTQASASSSNKEPTSTSKVGTTGSATGNQASASNSGPKPTSQGPGGRGAPSDTTSMSAIVGKPPLTGSGVGTQASGTVRPLGASTLDAFEQTLSPSERAEVARTRLGAPASPAPTSASDRVVRGPSTVSMIAPSRLEGFEQTLPQKQRLIIARQQLIEPPAPHPSSASFSGTSANKGRLSARTRGLASGRYPSYKYHHKAYRSGSSFRSRQTGRVWRVSGSRPSRRIRSGMAFQGGNSGHAARGSMNAPRQNRSSSWGQVFRGLAQAANAYGARTATPTSSSSKGRSAPPPKVTGPPKFSWPRKR